MTQRDNMIESFTTDASVTVFLMSLKAGGGFGLWLEGPDELLTTLLFDRVQTLAQVLTSQI
jgi:hypothetical protein